MNILVFSGTSDGNEIITKLAKKMYNIFVCVATDYGKELVADGDFTVLSGRLDITQIQNLIVDENINFVIDATHPYAVEVSQNIITACDNINSSHFIKLFRLLREQSLYDSHITLVDDIKSACNLCYNGNVLATTGSKQIHEYTVLNDYENRLFARVLPTEESVLLCENIGLFNDNIITSLGALSVEENIDTINNYNIKFMITKDGGVKGGFPQKSQACLLTNTKLFVIKRPVELSGLSVDEILSKIIETSKN